MAITKELIDGLIVTIQNLYLADDIPWMVGYSGGKDSTAAVQLVWMALEKLPKKDRKKPIHIMNTDTLVESPVVSKWVEKSLESMRIEAEKIDLPIIPERLTPDYNNTFWVNLIGRGYPFPRMKYRWCTDRLKIQPVNNFIKNKIAEHGEIILVLGTRKQESSRRNRTMTNLEKKRVRELLSPNPTLANELVFSPMEDWTDDDVWAFLMQYKNPWNYSNKDLLTMYRGATADNECPLQVDKSTQSCGKTRFGCWVCTMVEKDKSMEAMIANDQGNYGKLFHGPYKKEVREQWLERLLSIQKEINENGPEEFRSLELIRLEELQAIRRIWVNDKHEFDDALPRIYEKVLGKAFIDPTWLHNENFESEEWDILKKVCSEMYPEEELAQRKNILDDINKNLAKTFYKDETDATEYYSNMMVRKKENGGKYNEKFLDYQPIETEFEDNEDE